MKEKNDSDLEEGIDYYIENEMIVFTEKYHKDRGFCCESNCRHCPYGFGEKEIT